ncbi:O-sialoglycoprotein endopeptidase [Thalassoporum mexicanum PCC 7367]|uniref:tRNA (adenosine(37)-N6)-threonylcarbamoyltransferase complex transferase subunit TsaD n=1 Tax=Thalassoporum mexicanum TaxID=3457544 RepID=UPI00029F83DD|nr:tRNA (adenosine(37)-N6)-threonylcarbamoyltransferase complex transferase subunit TsaD [Pseudanabaena sp. PCC 7367]AFY68688.1 O-sialoglycoprotein endopeptidase [Pseudanabaena sp. PCC 7367]
MPTVLAIETSCDETAAAVVRDRHCLSSVVSSQIDIHAAYGGVVPEIAARQHLETINLAISQAFGQANRSWAEIDGIAVTAAPGLIGALMVGITAAKTLALLHQKPLIGVHHLEGHIFSAFLAEPSLEPPFLCLLVSGGHSSLILVKDYGDYEIAGQTRDDAAGEAFDKVARLLKLGYPGGPAIDKIAVQGNPKAFNLPQGRIANHPYDSSFSGLKTAVLRLVEKLAAAKEQANDRNPLPIADIAASFQATVAKALSSRTVKCAIAHNLTKIVAVGGVAANTELRSQLLNAATEHNLTVIFPPLSLCTDNAAMIGCAGAMHLARGETSRLELAARSRLELTQAQSLYLTSGG